MSLRARPAAEQAALMRSSVSANPSTNSSRRVIESPPLPQTVLNLGLVAGRRTNVHLRSCNPQPPRRSSPHQEQSAEPCPLAPRRSTAFHDESPTAPAPPPPPQHRPFQPEVRSNRHRLAD